MPSTPCCYRFLEIKGNIEQLIITFSNKTTDKQYIPTKKSYTIVYNGHTDSNVFQNLFSNLLPFALVLAFIQLIERVITSIIFFLALSITSFFLKSSQLALEQQRNYKNTLKPSWSLGVTMLGTKDPILISLRLLFRCITSSRRRNCFFHRCYPMKI